MNVRILAALFIVIFLLGSVPMLLVQPSGAASAGLSGGFMLPLQSPVDVSALIFIGLLAAWFGHEAIMLIPLCSLLMLTIGAMLQIDEHQFHAVRSFLAGAIILFALTVSMLRQKIYLISIPPIAGWLYFAGNNFMVDVPSITTPIYFLLGGLISSALILSIGVSFGVTLADSAHDSLERFKASHPTLRSLF